MNYNNNMRESIQFIDTNELAEILSVSVKFIEKHCKHIKGGQKIGKIWRFNLITILECINNGENILTNQNIFNKNMKKVSIAVKKSKGKLK